MTSVWDEAICDTARRHPFVFLGHAPGKADALRRHGADVLAEVRVHAAGTAGRAAPDAAALDICVEGTELQLQADRIGRALEEHEREVASFLDRHDPDRQAWVLSAQSVPRRAAQGRPCWAPDTALARRLEEKRTVGAVLDQVLPWVSGQPAPPSADEGWWRELVGHGGGLVVQAAGWSAGGESTWICRSLAEARAALARCPVARVAPWLDGDPMNVGGVVSAGGEVMVLPPSRQLVVQDAAGRPRYCGNLLGDNNLEDVAGIEADARTAGAALAEMGYVGMFGLDGIQTSDGVRYHDLNARMNGAMVAYDLYLPVVVGALLLSGWADADRVAAAEQELRAAVAERPVARWRVTLEETEPSVVGTVPEPGVYRLDPSTPAFTAVTAEPPAGPAAVTGDRVLVLPRIASGTPTVAGDRTPLADLYCTPDVSRALVAAHGSAVVDRVADAVLVLGGE